RVNGKEIIPCRPEQYGKIPSPNLPNTCAICGQNTEHRVRDGLFALAFGVSHNSTMLPTRRFSVRQALTVINFPKSSRCFYEIKRQLETDGTLSKKMARNDTTQRLNGGTA